VTGTTYGDLDGDVQMGRGDIFVSKLAPDGETVWTRTWGTPSTERVGGVVAGDAGSVFIVAHSTEALYETPLPHGGGAVVAKLCEE
jgi:hypothetical protein